MDLFLNFLQPLHEILFLDIGQNQKKFISAVANQNIGFPDTAADDLYGSVQDSVTGLMAVGVVVHLEIVQIDHCHTGSLSHHFQLFFIVPSIYKYL